MTTNLVKATAMRSPALPQLSVREECEALLCQQSLGHFVPAAWRHAGEPKGYQSNWHIDLLCDHLMAVARREIKGPGPLIFSMPPRHMKSRAINVFFPGWVWAQDPDPNHEGHGLYVRPGTLSGPGVKFAHLSYVQKLSNEHSDACRRLVSSDWYQARWGRQCRLDRDQIELFSNLAGGERRAMSFTGLTGFGADIIVVDDAHDIKTIDSEVARAAVLRTWDEVLQTRLSDPKTGIFVVMMQRGHERDLIGHILAKEFNGMHVCLPAEHERNHPYVFLKAKPGWEVPRKSDSSNGADGGPKIGEPWYDFRQDGDPLWVSRFPKHVLRERTAGMTSHAVAGQFQQRPTAREGGLFKRAWFANPMPIADRDAFIASRRLQCVRSWDWAWTEPEHGKEPDYSVGVLLGSDRESTVCYILDLVRGRFSPAQLEQLVVTTAMRDGYETSIRIPEDPGAGKFVSNYMAKKLVGFRTVIEREAGMGNKAVRAAPFAAHCENRFVVIAQADWNKAFVEELCAFPNGANDDQVDAAAAAFRAAVRRPQFHAVGA